MRTPPATVSPSFTVVFVFVVLTFATQTLSAPVWQERDPNAAAGTAGPRASAPATTPTSDSPMIERLLTTSPCLGGRRMRRVASLLHVWPLTPRSFPAAAAIDHHPATRTSKLSRA